MGTDRRKPKYSVETCKSTFLSTTDPKLTTLGYSSDLHFVRLITNVLENGRPCCVLLYNM